MFEFLDSFQNSLWGSASAIARTQTLGALFAAGVALWAIRRNRIENRRWQTLAVCGQFEFSATVATANRKMEELFEKGVPGKAECLAHKFDAIVVLNYLDGIAIGVKQGLYIESLARDHLKTIVHIHVRNLLETTFAQDANLDKQHWFFLVGMAERWRKNQVFYSWINRFFNFMTRS